MELDGSEYIVVREYSNITAKKTLWQVLSRPIKNKRDAEFQCSWEQGNYPKSRVFLIKEMI